MAIFTPEPPLAFLDRLLDFRGRSSSSYSSSREARRPSSCSSRRIEPGRFLGGSASSTISTSSTASSSSTSSTSSSSGEGTTVTWAHLGHRSFFPLGWGAAGLRTASHCVQLNLATSMACPGVRLRVGASGGRIIMAARPSPCNDNSERSRRNRACHWIGKLYFIARSEMTRNATEGCAFRRS